MNIINPVLLERSGLVALVTAEERELPIDTQVRLAATHIGLDWDGLTESDQAMWRSRFLVYDINCLSSGCERQCRMVVLPDSDGAWFCEEHTT